MSIHDMISNGLVRIEPDGEGKKVFVGGYELDLTKPIHVSPLVVRFPTHHIVMNQWELNAGIKIIEALQENGIELKIEAITSLEPLYKVLQRATWVGW